MVSFLLMFDEQERISKFIVQGFRVVSHYGQTTAFIRSILSESGNDHVPTWFNGFHNPFYISMAISRIS